jgi:hypothetical protein
MWEKLLEEEYTAVGSRVTISIDYKNNHVVLYGIPNEEEIPAKDLAAVLTDLEAAIHLLKLAIKKLGADSSK